ncbi:hypothetical protein R1sor_025666 [Riccia sorocarpa]|uniref:Retrotransposon gag domain-containing protein n=1 Tax=Riccia sorocarpa TaxID=122646 RepID=A0ABD3G983_9MARC
MATSITRFRYPSYRGKESEDPDAFVEEFNQIATEKATWAALRKAFLTKFRSLGFNKQVYNRLATLDKKKKELLRTYTQRFRDLVNRLTNKPIDEQAVEWYICGLPTDLAFQCRKASYSSSEEEETSTSESSSSESDESSTRRSKTSARRKKKEAKRRDSSEGSSSSEEERKPTSSSKRKSKTDKGHTKGDCRLSKGAGIF